MTDVGRSIKTTATIPSHITSRASGEVKTEEDVWEEREKRLGELLEEGGSNPRAREDFNRLLGEMGKGSKEA